MCVWERTSLECRRRRCILYDYLFHYYLFVLRITIKVRYYCVLECTISNVWVCMCATAAEDVRKARDRDRFRLAPVRFARAVTPGSTNGDALICKKRFLDRCFLTIFFLFHLFVVFFFKLFYFSSPSSRRRRIYLPIGNTTLYHDIIPRTPFSRSGSVTLPNSTNS